MSALLTDPVLALAVSAAAGILLHLALWSLID
jgi:hypothetical protein